MSSSSVSIGMKTNHLDLENLFLKAIRKKKKILASSKIFKFQKVQWLCLPNPILIVTVNEQDGIKNGHAVAEEKQETL